MRFAQTQSVKVNTKYGQVLTLCYSLGFSPNKFICYFIPLAIILQVVGSSLFNSYRVLGLVLVTVGSFGVHAALCVCLWQSPRSRKLSVFAIIIISTVAVICDIITALPFISNKKFLLVNKLDCPLKLSADLYRCIAYSSAPRMLVLFMYNAVYKSTDPTRIKTPRNGLVQGAKLEPYTLSFSY